LSRKIRGVNIHKCCADCFLGDKDNRLYSATHGKDKVYPMSIEMEIEPHNKYLAYYLCGLSPGFKYEANTHVAFIHVPGKILTKETEQITLEITNANLIDFEGYVPNPHGEFTSEQRPCRNWIFANYLNDKML
jgi:hypothetical protein